MPSLLHKLVKIYTRFRGLFLGLWVVFLLPSCNTFIGKGYNDTTARYNSYFLAKESMKDVDAALKAYPKDDYHNTLSIHYYSDSLFGKSQNEALERIFKYASWSVRWHKRSKWADNNYILIGKVRHYQYNYKDGLETFRYVNSTSPSSRERHEALIQLMHFFTDFGELDNVKYVIDFMDTEKDMTKKNRRNYLIAKASYYQVTNHFQQVHQILDTVLPMCRRKHDKAKLRFINGQVCEQLKQDAGETKTMLDFDSDKEAFKNYKSTIKANPKYELLFNARMNLMRVKKHSDLDDLKKARKYYHTTLADLKNTEYKDRIYYDFAGFERKQKEYSKAEEYYKKSAENATNNNRQKAYTYLALGEMYYEELERFEDAKLYYDSTIAILPRDHKNYGRIYRRQRILKDFVEHLTTVRLEDSLQKLARMDTIQLSSFLNDYITKEEKKLNDEVRRLAKIAKQKEQASQTPFNDDFVMSSPNATGTPTTNSPAGFTVGNQAAVFYFYNKTFATQGKIEFQQKWGRRRLEDFWRISNKESDNSDRFENTNATSDTFKLKSDSAKMVSKTINDKSKNEKDEEKEIKIDKSELYKNIPLTEEKMKVSNGKLQTSLFRLGKIYYQHLNEPTNSISSFERLIKEYPDNENVPEAHYMIYLMMKGKDSVLAETHKNILLDKYSHTLYAKLLKNPNYLTENKILNKQIMARYRVAYMSYLSRDYKTADSLFVQIQSDYPENEYDPKIDLMRSIMKARSGRREDYRGELEAFVSKYPKGQYHDYAQALIDKYDGKIPKAATDIKVDSASVKPSLPTDLKIQNDQLDDGSGSSQPSEPSQNQMPEEIRNLIEEQKRNINQPQNRNLGPPPISSPNQQQMLEQRKGF